MIQLLPVFLFFVVLTVNAQQAPELIYDKLEFNCSKEYFNVEKHSRYGINNQYPIQIGSAYIYPGSSPIEVYTPVPAYQPSNFHILLITIFHTPFDDKKILIANQFIKENGIYSLQLHDILSLLSFDTNKLILAKAAYTHVIDKEYFLTVITTLELISSRNQLIEALILVP